MAEGHCPVAVEPQPPKAWPPPKSPKKEVPSPLFCCWLGVCPASCDAPQQGTLARQRKKKKKKKKSWSEHVPRYLTAATVSLLPQLWYPLGPPSPHLASSTSPAPQTPSPCPPMYRIRDGPALVLATCSAETRPNRKGPKTSHGERARKKKKRQTTQCCPSRVLGGFFF